MARRFFGVAPSGTMSRRRTGMPQLARWAAMREPMVPAPRTAALQTSMGSAEDAGLDASAAMSAVADAAMRLPSRVGTWRSETKPERSRAYEDALGGVKAP